EIEAIGHGSAPREAPALGDDAAGVDDDPLAFRNHGGLGIPIALETVSRMGGHVTVDDETGQPASIQFTIRLGISEDEEQARPVVDSRPPLERPILIIAEALDDRRSIVKTLSESNLPYVVASSADEWAATRTSNGDRTIEPTLAVIAPAQDSFIACDRFRELAASVPVIVIAPFGQRGDAARCREHGVRGYLAKPMDPGDLVDVVKATTALTESGDTSTFVTRHWLRDGRRSLHVLVVDDSPTSLFLMTRMLEQRGHSTTSACNGREAIEAFQRDTFDIVLMDIMMPGIDGLEATRLIRSMDAGSAQRPLIVGVSAFTDQSSVERGRDAGMDAMLPKPIRPDDLFALIEQQTATESTRNG
ncbi:MAG: response regulator, partial [Acidimicrobiia bacterium]|nr:response regulator [Acidimicrobiia bacterium]